MGTPSRVAIVRLRRSSRSATRSAMYGPAAASMARNSSKASTTAVMAALPACTPSVTLEARVGSSAIMAWAASTLAASPGARAARSSRLVATAFMAAMAAWFSASGSPEGAASVGTTGGGAICATGPAATPGLTPMPLSDSAIGYSSLSRSLATRAASSSRAWSPPALAMVTFTGCFAAAWTNMAAGRACRPTLEPTATRRSGMWYLRLRHAGTSPALHVPDSINGEAPRRPVRPYSPASASLRSAGGGAEGGLADVALVVHEGAAPQEVLGAGAVVGDLRPTARRTIAAARRPATGTAHDLDPAAGVSRRLVGHADGSHRSQHASGVFW